MHGSVIKPRNEPEAMRIVYPLEFIYTLAGAGIEQITTDPTLFFQKLWLYPAKAVAAGVPTANTAAIRVGKSGVFGAVALTGLVLDKGVGPLVKATKAAHGLPNGASVDITGATPAQYNGTFTIFNVDANNFFYRPLTLPATQATVLGTATRTQYLPDVLELTDLPSAGAPGNPMVIELPLGQRMPLSQIVLKGTAGDGVLAIAI